MRYLLSICVVASISMAALAGTGVADPSDLIIADVPPHRHFIQTASGKLVPVGPQGLRALGTDAGVRAVPPQRPPLVRTGFWHSAHPRASGWCSGIVPSKDAGRHDNGEAVLVSCSPLRAEAGTRYRPVNTTVGSRGRLGLYVTDTEIF
jgi:hypothetical protein